MCSKLLQEFPKLRLDMVFDMLLKERSRNCKFSNSAMRFSGIASIKF